MAMPQATYGGDFLHTDIYEMAAAYLFHLVKNHPFIDGNKRVGAVSAIVFLFLNDLEFTAPEEEFAEIVLSVARGDIDKTDIALFMRRFSERV